MGLFIIFAICIFLYLLLGEDGIINYFKTMEEYNKDIKRKIDWRRTNYDVFPCREYCEKDYRNLSRGIKSFVFWNLLLNVINITIVFLISFFATALIGMEPYNYSFDIKSLKDNNQIEGEFRGTVFSTRGYIGEELSYSYLREYEQGEKIEHIPANNTYIKYDDEIQPHITVYKERIAPTELMKFMLFDEFLDGERVIRYELTVPTGTVQNDVYEIDME